MKRSDDIVNAVVLAGRRNDGKLKDVTPETWEAMIDIAGRPMVSWVIDGLMGSRYVQHTTLVAPRSPFAEAYENDRVTVVEPGATMVENVVLGCKASPPGEFVLLCTSDIPLISPQVVDRFVDLCRQKPDGDFFYPVVPKAAAEARFPGVHRTYAGIREGTFTGGNIMMVRASKVEVAAERADIWVKNRKSPIRQAGLLGWSFAIKLLLHTLTIPELERTISRYFMIQAKAIICPDPEIGVDVDKPSDLDLARREMQKTA